MKYFQSWISHQCVIQLLEFSQRCSVVLRSSFSQNIDTEVSLMDLVVVRLLIFGVHLLSLLLQVHECPLKLVLLFLKSWLDDLGTGQKPFLKVLQSLVLNHDGTFFIKSWNVLKVQFLKNWKKVVFLFLFFLLVGNLCFSLLHLVPSFLLNRFL